MKKPSEDLFLLIKSLSAEEKRYFTIFSRQFKRNEPTLYLELFEAITRLDTYDEQALREVFSSRLSPNKFAVAKHYLYNNILKALTGFHNQKGAIKKVRQELDFMDILFSRELYAQCRSHLKKIENLMQDIDNPLLWLEVVDWKFKLGRINFFSDITEDEFEKLIDEHHFIKEKVNHFLEYQKLNNRFFYLLCQEGFVRASSDFKRDSDAILELPPFANSELADSIPSKTLYYNTWGIFHYLKGDFEKSYWHYKQLFQIINSNTNMVYDNPNFFLSILFNFGAISLQLKNLASVEEVINRLELLDSGGTKLKAKIFYYSSILKCRSYLDSLSLTYLNTLTRETEEKLIRFGQKLNKVELYAIYFNLALISFTQEDYSKALKYLGLVINDPGVNNYSDILVITRLVQIIVHFELGDIELMSRIATNVYRSILKKGQKFKHEILLLKFFRKYPGETNPTEIQRFFFEIRKEFQTSMAERQQNSFVQYFDFDSWLEAKARGVGIATVMRERLNQQIPSA